MYMRDFVIKRFRMKNTLTKLLSPNVAHSSFTFIYMQLKQILMFFYFECNYFHPFLLSDKGNLFPTLFIELKEYKFVYCAVLNLRKQFPVNVMLQNKSCQCYRIYIYIYITNKFACLFQADFGTYLPFVIFGLSSLIAGILALILPETIHIELKDKLAPCDS